MLLTDMFILQEEVVVRSGDEHSLRGVPETMRRAEYGTNSLSRVARDEQRFETYMHSHAVSVFDQVVTDRATADEFSILHLGIWDNETDLITDLGYGTVDQPIINGLEGRNGESAPLDSTSRVIAARRCFEERKVAPCISEVIPTTLRKNSKLYTNKVKRQNALRVLATKCNMNIDEVKRDKKSSVLFFERTS